MSARAVAEMDAVTAPLPTARPARSWRPRAWRWVIAACAVVPLIVLFIGPLGILGTRSFEAEGGGWNLDNYLAILQAGGNRGILLRTLWVALETSVLAVVIAVPCALALFRFRAVVAARYLIALLLPVWTSFVVSLFGMGLVLRQLGIQFTHAGTVIGMLAYVLPFAVMLVYASMSNVDRVLLQSARSMGASWLRSVVAVLLPLSRGGVIAAFLLCFILSLGFYLVPAMLGGPGDTSVAMYIQQQVSILQWGKAAAMGVLLLIAAAVLYVAVARLGRMDALGAMSQGGTRGVSAETKARTPRWAKVTLNSLLVLVLAFEFLPIAIVLLNSFSALNYYVLFPTSFSLQWYEQVLDSRSWIKAATLSLQIGLLSATLATVWAFFFSLLVERYARRSRSLLRIGASAPLIVPAILFAAGFYALAAQLRIDGTLWGFVLAHTVLCLPFGFSVISGALSSASRELEHAALSMKAPARVAFWHSVRPALIPGLLTSFLLCFVTSWGEIIVSLIISGFTTTLPVQIYHHTQSELSLETAAVSALMILGVAVAVAIGSVGLYIARRARDRGALRPAEEE